MPTRNRPLRGAATVLVIEYHAGSLPAAELPAVHTPLVRALGHTRLEGIALGGCAMKDAGYPSFGEPFTGASGPPEVAVVAPDLWGLPPDEFSERFSDLLAAANVRDEVLIVSDGPLPAGMPLENLGIAQARGHM